MVQFHSDFFSFTHLSTHLFTFFLNFDQILIRNLRNSMIILLAVCLNACCHCWSLCYHWTFGIVFRWISVGLGFVIIGTFYLLQVKVHWSIEALTPAPIIIIIITWQHWLMHQLVLLWLSVVLNIFLYFSVLHHLQVPVNWAIWVWSGYSCCACPFSHLHLVIWPWRQWGPTLTLILDVK